jgi:hypothetical protein
MTFNQYVSGGYSMEIELFLDLGPDRCFPVEPRRCAALLEQTFWDDPEPPTGCWKKVWLRPHLELAIDEADFDYPNSGCEFPAMPPSKRRRLSDAATERKRVDDASEKWDDYMEVAVR